MNDIKKTARLEVLENSLAKKKAKLEERFDTHFASVKQANGQPLNDKRGGLKVIAKWEKQNDGIRAIQDSIKRTEAAIERELDKIVNVESAQETTPEEILDLVAEGKLVQWRKHPNFFFMKGVDKARMRWDDETKELFVRYHASVEDPAQRKIMCELYNPLRKILAEKYKGFHEELANKKKSRKTRQTK